MVLSQTNNSHNLEAGSVQLFYFLLFKLVYIVGLLGVCDDIYITSSRTVDAYK